MNICYTEEVEYDLESLGNNAWLTGCPLCGDQCWLIDKKKRDEINKYIYEKYPDNDLTK